MDFGKFILLAPPALILIGLAGLVIFLIAKALGYLVGIAARNHPELLRLKRNAVRAGYVLAISLIAYETYSAIYPGDSFYLDEFEIAAARKPPETARVLFKDALYPDFHGDYCSFSRMELSRSDYDRLLHELSVDPGFTGGDSSAVSAGAMFGTKLPPL